jgi:hypothetical protein
MSGRKIKIKNLVAVLCLFSSVLKAQDTIRLKSGLMLYGLITEVNNREIKFRVDGGSVTLDQVLSYQKNGQSVAVNNLPNSGVPSASIQMQRQECDIKNVGDVEFDNRTTQAVYITIYATGSLPEPTGLDNKLNNPIVTEISVAPGSKGYSYNLTTGIHFIYYSFSPGRYSAQIKIEKCGKAVFVIKSPYQ